MQLNQNNIFGNIFLYVQTVYLPFNRIPLSKPPFVRLSLCIYSFNIYDVPHKARNIKGVLSLCEQKYITYIFVSIQSNNVLTYSLCDLLCSKYNLPNCARDTNTNIHIPSLCFANYIALWNCGVRINMSIYSLNYLYDSHMRGGAVVVVALSSYNLLP